MVCTGKEVCTGEELFVLWGSNGGPVVCNVGVEVCSVEEKYCARGRGLYWGTKVCT